MDCLFLVNPVSGSGEGLELLEHLQHWSSPGMRISAIYTDPDRLEAQVHSMAKGKDLLVVAGGDGTIHAVLSLLAGMDQPPPAAIIPLGTGNDLARSTGWLDVWNAGGLEIFFAALEKVRAEALDTWQVLLLDERGQVIEAHPFICYFGLGLDGAICRGVEAGRRKGRREGKVAPLGSSPLGQGHVRGPGGSDGAGCGACGVSSGGSRFRTRLAFVLHGLRGLFLARRVRGQLSFDQADGVGQGQLRINSAQLLFSNICSYSGGSLLPGRGDFSDGLLDLYNYRSALGFFFCVLVGMIARRSRGLIRRYETGGAEIFLEESAEAQSDGEFLATFSAGSRLRVEHLRKIPFLIPPQDLFVRKRMVKPVHFRFYGNSSLAVKTSHFGSR